MVDLSSFNKSLKTTWIRKYLDTSNHGKWKEFVKLDLEKYTEILSLGANVTSLTPSRQYELKTTVQESC